MIWIRRRLVVTTKNLLQHYWSHTNYDEILFRCNGTTNSISGNRWASISLHNLPRSDWNASISTILGNNFLFDVIFPGIRQSSMKFLVFLLLNVHLRCYNYVFPLSSTVCATRSNHISYYWRISSIALTQISIYIRIMPADVFRLHFIHYPSKFGPISW